uniref:Uncharacterized protein n=1 Tax=Oryza barthii TaxID=65489 RepID=A0A0D3GI53_9ORYZ
MALIPSLATARYALLALPPLMVAAYVYNGGGRGNGDRPRARSINKFTDGGPATAGPAARKDNSAL